MLKSYKIFQSRVDIVNNYSQYIFDGINNQTGQFVVTTNPEIIYSCYKNRNFAKIINKANLIIPDGIGVTIHFWMRGIRVPKQPGIEISAELLNLLDKSIYTPIKNTNSNSNTNSNIITNSKDKLNQNLASNSSGESVNFESTNVSVFLVGAKSEVIEKCLINLGLQFPNITFVGYDGYFDSSKEQIILDNISSTKPQLILVGLGSPTQENWIIENQNYSSSSTWIGVGGSFDIWSGTKKRAPRIMIKLGLEWLYRLYQEPHRILRMTVLPKFLVISIIDRFFPKD